MSYAVHSAESTPIPPGGGRFMRMAELSAESGVPVATIKYYLREDLLPPGARTSPNQARYDRSHLHRLRLVRALLDIGGLSVAQAREMVAGIDSAPDAHAVLGTAQAAISTVRGRRDGESHVWAGGLLDEVARRHGWSLTPGNPAVDLALDTLATFAELEHPELVARLDEYAGLADRVAELDLAGLSGRPEREAPERKSVVDAAVVGMVLGDALFAALRRLAQEHASARMFRP
ncbi:MAG: MerR family transcriptional regulator [Pseudonocardia sp.]